MEAGLRWGLSVVSLPAVRASLECFSRHFRKYTKLRQDINASTASGQISENNRGSIYRENVMVCHHSGDIHNREAVHYAAEGPLVRARFILYSTLILKGHMNVWIRLLAI